MNDDTPLPPFAEHKAMIANLVANLSPGPDGLASHHELLRQLDRMRPGSIDREHARQQRRRLGLEPLAGLDALDYAGA
ncbi:hypothetical protein [Brevundimonas sp. NIBR11]|uniref:hypothetical protein n=1 Tax=Brevundimonas sp. NIBR11 TaxID=3015999 RepID=UPI0022EFF4D0|nr:hypothetical protein [Brevundimonas sp. NIBR11]WGM31533.1 hypothetical protein KKHFBJBL_01780 [Brevundimonas sp. NIBR11]